MRRRAKVTRQRHEPYCIETRLRRLESGRPDDLQALSDSELDARIAAALDEIGGIALARELFADDPVMTRLLNDCAAMAVYKDTEAPMEMRLDAAKAAIRFQTPALSSVDQKGDTAPRYIAYQPQGSTTPEQ